MQLEDNEFAVIQAVIDHRDQIANEIVLTWAKEFTKQQVEQLKKDMDQYLKVVRDRGGIYNFLEPRDVVHYFHEPTPAIHHISFETVRNIPFFQLEGSDDEQR